MKFSLAEYEDISKKTFKHLKRSTYRVINFLFFNLILSFSQYIIEIYLCE